MNYNLKFKRFPNEKGFWHTQIKATTYEEAVKEADEIVKKMKKNGDYNNISLEQLTYKYKTVYKWEE